MTQPIPFAFVRCGGVVMAMNTANSPYIAGTALPMSTVGACVIKGRVYVQHFLTPATLDPASAGRIVVRHRCCWVADVGEEREVEMTRKGSSNTRWSIHADRPGRQGIGLVLKMGVFNMEELLSECVRENGMTRAILRPL
jgi:hypothetical protein